MSHAPNCFAIESSIDELAAAASKNPLDFRLDLLRGKPRHTQVLKTVAERSGWGRAARDATRASPSWRATPRTSRRWRRSPSNGGQLKVHRITCVIDCGQTVNPRIVESQIESGIVYGLSAALWGDITLRNGRVQQSNFNDYRVLRLNETARARRPHHSERWPPGRHRRARRADRWHRRSATPSSQRRESA